MGKKCNNIEMLEDILSNEKIEKNDIGGDAQQVDYKIDTTVISIYRGTGNVSFRGKKSSCNVQEIIEKKIDFINELNIPIICENK